MLEMLSSEQPCKALDSTAGADAMQFRVGSVPVFVSDQQRALEFYCNKLQYRVVLDIPIGGDVRWLTVTSGPGDTELILLSPDIAGADGGANKMRERVGTWTGIIILTEDCRTAHRVLVERGVKFTTDPNEPFWGGWIAEFVDPDGNRLQLVERPPHM
jgi:predicted enzyme related to lactoylglutathione lyase